MTYKKKKLITGFAVLALLGIAYGGYEYYKDRQELQEKEMARHYLADVAEICLQKFPAKNGHEKIRNLRHCVFIYSEFNTQKNMRPVWENEDALASWMLDYTNQKKGKAPPMECSIRSRTLGEMLKTQGFESRDLTITRDEDGFNDHVVREVLNPDTGKWEVHDPSYDVEFVSLGNKKVLSIKDMLRAGTDKFMPCNYEGRCGWDFKTKEGFALEYNKGYWNIAWVKAIRTLYTTKRMDVNAKRKVNGENMSYCEFRAKWCRDKIEALD